MATVQFCGEWLVCSCDRRLLTVHSSQDRDPFELDCASLEKKPKKVDSESEQAEADCGSDQILAVAAAPSGKLVALSDDSKRLVLLRVENTWSVVSVRWLPRRCTALVFSRSEDRLLAADKSGDVYSLSVTEPLKEPELQLGHLSMVLDVEVSNDDRFIVTSDRDEKIRVSLTHSPYNIQAFCLGHQQFVSTLLCLSGDSRSLLSGSGDGTVCVWDLETGCRLQTVELREHLRPTQETQRLTVSRLRSSADGHLVAVLCESLCQIVLYCVDQTEEGAVLRPHSGLPLPHCPVDLTFDPRGRLWVLLNRAQRPLQVYSLTQDSWEQVDVPSGVSAPFRTLWDSADESQHSSSRLQHLYVETYDNVSEYMKKKQQRLEQQNHKRSRDRSRDRDRDQDQDRPKKTRSLTQTETNGS